MPDRRRTDLRRDAGRDFERPTFSTEASEAGELVGVAVFALVAIGDELDRVVARTDERANALQLHRITIERTLTRGDRGRRDADDVMEALQLHRVTVERVLARTNLRFVEAPDRRLQTCELHRITVERAFAHPHETRRVLVGGKRELEARVLGVIAVERVRARGEHRLHGIARATREDRLRAALLARAPVEVRLTSAREREQVDRGSGVVPAAVVAMSAAVVSVVVSSSVVASVAASSVVAAAIVRITMSMARLRDREGGEREQREEQETSHAGNDACRCVGFGP